MRILHIIFLIFLIPLSIYVQHSLEQFRKINRSIELSTISGIPSNIVNITSLEFRGVVADYLFLNTLSFMGDRLINHKSLTDQEYKIIYSRLDLITDLDPKANDPYTLAQTSLPFEANMVHETNNLLLKSIAANPRNYRIYLFLWFNQFHFLKNPEKAGYYLEQASKIPDAPLYWSTLAARMKAYAGKHEQAIIFLTELIRETLDPNQKNILLLRLDALKRMAFLEQKVRQYKNEIGHFPNDLNELISKGFLKSIPADPYGGQFYLLPGGRIYTTSKLVISNHKKSQN